MKALPVVPVPGHRATQESLEEVRRWRGFIGGDPWRVEHEGKTVENRFEDDQWFFVAKVGGKRRLVSVSFTSLPRWSGRWARIVIAQMILVHDSSFSAVARLPGLLARAFDLMGDVEGVEDVDGLALTKLSRRLNLAVIEHGRVLAELRGELGRKPTKGERKGAMDAASAISPQVAGSIVRSYNRWAAGYRADTNAELPKATAPRIARRSASKGIGSADAEKVLDPLIHGGLIESCDQDLADLDELRSRMRELAEPARGSDVKYHQVLLHVVGAEGGPRFGAEVDENPIGPIHPTNLGQMWQAFSRLAGKADADELRRLWGTYKALHFRAVLSCALKLQLCFGRRLSEVFDLPVDVPTKWVEIRGEQHLEIKVRLEKMHGAQGTEQWIRLPRKFGVWADEAIQEVRRITRYLRGRYAGHPETRRLFIYHGTRIRSCTASAADNGSMYRYLKGYGSTTEEGLFNRLDWESILGRHYSSSAVQQYERRLQDWGPHEVRHTFATTILSEGGLPKHAATFLGHGPNPTMALRFYFAGGSEEARSAFAEQVREGHVRGQLIDPVLSIYYQRQLPHEALPADLQMTVAEAMERLERSHYTAVVQDFTPEGLLEHWDRYGILLKVGRHGACGYGVEWCDCPAEGHDCSVGISTAENVEDPGCGCLYQAITPAQADQLDQDLDVLHGARHLAEQGGKKRLVEKLSWEIEVKEGQHERIRRML